MELLQNIDQVQIKIRPKQIELPIHQELIDRLQLTYFLQLPTNLLIDINQHKLIELLNKLLNQIELALDMLKLHHFDLLKLIFRLIQFVIHLHLDTCRAIFDKLV